jgi:2-C-methyl-D-erythritol 2,4-cyclodiphosphate synthase
VIRVGSGLDIHAFADGVPLWLGGIRIPHPRGLAGHSDGDAAIHALIDALLGAAGRGDIGEWFPSTDERWRGARSADLLRHVWTELSAADWRLENVDLTIVASEPRLAPYRLPMRQAIADALRCHVGLVSLKATTTDGLGALGRAEGVLAQATVLLTDEPFSTLT